MSDTPTRELLRDVTIEGYKSIAKTTFQLGRINVFIGENGSGKSNVLEALAIAAGSAGRKLDHEFLASRGVRSVEGSRMGTLLASSSDSKFGITVGLKDCQWVVDGLDALVGRNRALTASVDQSVALADMLRAMYKDVGEREFVAAFDPIARMAADSPLLSFHRVRLSIREFIALSPEYAALQTFRDEAQILPIGIHGEGLFAHLKHLAKTRPEVVDAIDHELRLLDWFDGFAVPNDLGPGEKRLDLRDRFLIAGETLDHRSANEGFLFLLLLFTLMHSPETPPFFAVDNVDTSLNPKLCTTVVRRMAELAVENDKQVILTTHNPHVLDGLDLNDDEQRLFAVSRTSEGATRVRRIPAPKPLEGDKPIRLSEAFVQGFLGGLPKNF